jgi:hypothetical protein
VEQISGAVEQISGAVERFSRPLGSFAVEEISRLGEGCGLAVEEFSGWPPIGGD